MTLSNSFSTRRARSLTSPSFEKIRATFIWLQDDCPSSDDFNGTTLLSPTWRHS